AIRFGVSVLANLALRPKGRFPLHLRGAGPSQRAQVCHRLPGLAKLSLAPRGCVPWTCAAPTPNFAKLRASPGETAAATPPERVGEYRRAGAPRAGPLLNGCFT